MSGGLEALCGGGVPAMPAGQKARYTADSRETHSTEAMNLPVGHAALQRLHHGPAVGHGLEFRGRAEIAQECPHLFRSLERCQRNAEVALGESFLAGGQATVGFHVVPLY